MPGDRDDLQDLVNQKIETLRPKLLDLSRRNPLVATKLSARSNAHVRVIDELPDVLFYNLCNNQAMRVVPLPALDGDPKDEQNETFQRALANARLIDPVYLGAAERLDNDSDDYLDLNLKIERSLKDRVRLLLGLPARPEKNDINIAQHARNNNISPSYDLPKAGGPEDERHSDLDIQTLFLPKDLERKLSALTSKGSTWIQETGINVLQGAFGFLEWGEPNASETSFAPLILLHVKFDKRKSSQGLEFRISSLGEEPEINTVLSEKLRIEFGIQLPPFLGGSIEAYLAEVGKVSPKALTWRVRRQVTFGVFPSARMAMFHDLNTKASDFGINEIIRPLFCGSGTQAAAPFADEYLIDDPEVERNVPALVMDADASQFSTLVDIANGKNVAVEGPPGTGKSQTIVNAIAAALAEGKKVLFVAEKMAALDVVRSRLEAIGLGEFLLPLQAERSTREAVIRSVRERLEMDSVPPVRFYDEQVVQFRTARDETARYIEILARKFEATDLTVHEILGKSIATAERLTDLPKPFQLAPFPHAEKLCAADVVSLASKGKALEAAAVKATSAAPWWAGVQIVALSRFDVEEIVELAKSAATAFGTLDEQVRSWQQLGGPAGLVSESMRSLSTILEATREVTDTSQLALLPALATKAASKALLTFLDDCRAHQANADFLAEFIPGAIVSEAIDSLDELEALCGQLGITDLSIATVAQSLSGKRQAIAMARKLAGQMQPFAEQVEGSEHWRFSDVRQIRELTARVGRDVIHGRNPNVADPAAPDIIRRLNETGRMLTRARHALSEHFLFAESTPTEHLAACAGTLRDAGVFRVLSGEYRRARKLYRRIAKTKFQREQASDQLEHYATWKRKESNFSADPQALHLYGLHFRGIETDFEFFDRVADFYRSVREVFAALDQKPIREFLLLAETEIVFQVPALDGYPEGVRLKTIVDGIDRMEADASARERACARLNELAELFRAGVTIETKNLAVLKQAVTVYLSEGARLDADPAMAAVLHSHFRGSQTGADSLSSLARLATQIVEFETSNQEIAMMIASGQSEAALALARQLQVTFAACAEMSAQLNKKTGLDDESPLNKGTYGERAAALRAAARDEAGLHAYADFASVRRAFEPTYFATINAYVAARDTYAGLGDVLEALASQALARRAYEKHGAVLNKFSGAKLNTLREQVADLDRKIIRSSRDMLRAKIKANAKPPYGVNSGRKSSLTDLALLENETSKKQRFIPVRDLTRRAGKALQELKPCWMMSPLAVAQYLPKGALTFDLCIIDEASQMPPEDSVGALARSRQAMIVGDTNQLPPSSFFRKMIDDDDVDDDDNVLNESILEMANATFRPARRLRWHYRSRHSALIRFSNRYVYNDDLVVFPSATEAMAGMGVEYRAVNGLYKSGTNAIEAREVVEAAARFMKTDAERSLGIVTLNQKQRDLIFEEMEFVKSRDPAVQRYVDDWEQRNEGLEQFFIKNLENVQGDERDIIFVGTVYGPEEPGARVMQRFGPINGVAGKRRLNVLFSRAKQLIVTFSSMHSEDIIAEANGNEGAYMLKRWLEYAATGVLDAGDLTAKEPDSDLEIFVMNQIRAMGCTPVPQVGVKGYSIDIGVKHPHWAHGFILGVECDGASFHSSKSARDRDRLRQDVLEGLGWRFHRIWSTDWFNNPAKQADILRGVIEERLKELRAMEAKFTRKTSAAPADVNGASLHPMPQEKAALSKPEIEPGGGPTATVKPSRNIITVGDTVRVRYLTEDKRVVQFTISAERSDPDGGIIYFKKPIAEALLGAEEGDEVEILVGSYLRSAIVEKIVSSLH